MLRACLVKAHIVNTHSPLVVLLGHQDRVCKPVWMQNLPDEAHVKELGYFFLYNPTTFIVKPSQVLLNQLSIGPDSQGMLGASGFLAFLRVSRQICPNCQSEI